MHTLVRAAARAACFALLALSIGTAAGQPQPAARIELGVRAGILLGDGKPANDTEVTGLGLRWRLDGPWSIRLAAQRQVFDAERPASWLGLRQDPGLKAIDAKATATLLSVGLQRDLGGPAADWGWFWHVDLGSAKPKVPTVSGPLEGGGRFEVRTRAKREWVLGAGLGLRYPLAAGWAVEAGLQVEHHQADWQVSDAVSGRSAKLGAYQAAGLILGLTVAF